MRVDKYTVKCGYTGDGKLNCGYTMLPAAVDKTLYILYVDLEPWLEQTAVGEGLLYFRCNCILLSSTICISQNLTSHQTIVDCNFFF